MNNKDKIILDLCGSSGAWSAPYRAAGYDVRLITLPDHDVQSYVPPLNVYGILAAPPCEQFSYARTSAKIPTSFEKGMETVQACLYIIWRCLYVAWGEHRISSFRFWCLENPKGYLRLFLGQPAMTFQPYEYGDGYTKPTCLWGNFNHPVKRPWDGKTISFKEHMELPDQRHRRTELRQKTPPGFADAFFKANR